VTTRIAPVLTTDVFEAPLGTRGSGAALRGALRLRRRHIASERAPHSIREWVQLTSMRETSVHIG